ncbi:hypothetical protein AAG570_007153 [Ranatra chinensis]|uniref:Uncharacterized protein n=1 Tax=Ranatra chinensis TaxID=642074 RepID=A0ABD0XW96_9HEMI
MASKRRNIFQKYKTQETTKFATPPTLAYSNSWVGIDMVLGCRGCGVLGGTGVAQEWRGEGGGVGRMGGVRRLEEPRGWGWARRGEEPRGWWWGAEPRGWGGGTPRVEGAATPAGGPARRQSRARSRSSSGASTNRRSSRGKRADAGSAPEDTSGRPNSDRNHPKLLRFYPQGN